MSEVTVYARCVLLEFHDGVAVAVAMVVGEGETLVVLVDIIGGPVLAVETVVFVVACARGATAALRVESSR